MGARRRISRGIPFAAAALMWLASTLGAADSLRPPWDRLLNLATACVTVGVTVWALLACLAGRRERIFTAGFREGMRAGIEAAQAGQRAADSAGVVSIGSGSRHKPTA